MRVGITVATVALTATVATLPAMALAAESGGLGIYPAGQAGSPTPWFQYHLAHGASQADSLTVQNYADLPMDILIYPVDATLAAGGGFGMMPQSAPLSDAGGWIGLAPRTLHLSPHSLQVIPFRFSVPAAASVGPHYAGIVAQPIPAGPTPTTGGAISLTVVSRVGVRLYETVPGTAHPRLAIDRLRPAQADGRISLRVVLHNAGNTLAIPAGQVTVTGLWGRRVAVLPLSAGHSLQPGQALARSVPTPLGAGGWPHRYRVQVRLTDSASGQAPATSATITFWTGSIPFTIARLGVILLLLLMGVLTWRRTRPKPV